MQTAYRTHTCGVLKRTDIGKTVKLCGWNQARRDHGGIIFIDLRDKYGLTQIVFDPKHTPDLYKEAEKLRREDVLQVSGKVRARPTGLENPKLITGEIEVLVDTLSIMSRSQTPPLEIEDRVEPNEDIRLKYRYLDLRRPKMQRNLLMRHNIIAAARDHFFKNGFMEIETPLLVKPTPEGARDYLVPSRVNPGTFYALPQSPQLYKQILMVAGCDRYFQVARCLRDEDLREDRQPEHTQFDLEMSFVSSEDVMAFVESLYHHIFKEVMGITLEKFPVLTYKESVARFGSDKPDMRFGLELIDVTDIAKSSEFSVFKDAESIKCINPETELSRKDFDKYIEFVQTFGAKGMAWARVTKDGLDSSIVKYLSLEIQKKLLERTKAKPGSALMFVADKPKIVADALGRLRLQVAQDLNLIPEGIFKFAWVKDFPLFAYNEEEARWEPEHHMFTMPKQEFVKDFEKRPSEVIGDLYDVTLNGTELGSGSIRVTNPELQERIMNFIGLSKDEAERKFGFLLHAYEYGAPVHGGMGLGVDRLVALMLGTKDIREVIAFPKNKNAQCPMDGCPSAADDKQLKELHLKLDVKK